MAQSVGHDRLAAQACCDTLLLLLCINRFWKEKCHKNVSLQECFRVNQLTTMLWWFPQSFMVISWHLSEIWPKIGKNHHRGSFNNPTVMALWLTRKLQHYYELHQNSAQMISWKFHDHIFSRWWDMSKSAYQQIIQYPIPGSQWKIYF